MSKKKIFLIVLFSILAVVCVSIDCWWGYVYFFAPDKEVINHFEFDSITTADGTQTEYVIKVKYFSNENENGVEGLEIMFNDFVDTKQNMIYSQGIQIVGNPSIEESDWEFVRERSEIISEYWSWFVYYGRYNEFGSLLPNTNLTVNYYQSDDGFKTTFGNLDNFSDNGFLITLENEDGEDELYKLDFRGSGKFDKNFYGKRHSNPFAQDYDYWLYYDYDIYSFANWTYKYVQTMENGTNSAHLLNYYDMFKFSKFDGNSYVETTEAENSKVKTWIENNPVIWFEKTADGIQQATDSIFNAVNNSSGYNNVHEDISTENYLLGKTLITCNIYDFDYVNVIDNIYCLKLKDSFISKYSSYSNSIVLSVQIDLDILEQNNIEFIGFTKDSGLDNFNVYECYKFENVDGEQIKTEVVVC